MQLDIEQCYYVKLVECPNPKIIVYHLHVNISKLARSVPKIHDNLLP